MTLPLLDKLAIHGPEAIQLEGRHGLRYWIRHPRAITGNQDVDESLSSYPDVVFQPPNRNPTHTPVVLGLQGMAAPYQWSAFLVPTLLDMGIVCVLLDAPLAGERSLIREHPGVILQHVMAILKRGVLFTTANVVAMMDVIACDLATVIALIRERHGLHDPRVALFGVSLGCLLSAYAFTRDGIGQRLLGVIGHADLQLFARSYTPIVDPPPGEPARQSSGQNPVTALWPGPPGNSQLLIVLRELSGGGELCIRANPMTYANRVGEGRRVRFLAGQQDHLVRPADATNCASRFRDGECYVVPGLGHGTTSSGPPLVDHVRTYLGTQLGDWRE